jgi:hypothetical protein
VVLTVLVNPEEDLEYTKYGDAEAATSAADSEVDSEEMVASKSRLRSVGVGVALISTDCFLLDALLLNPFCTEFRLHTLAFSR